LEAKRKKRVYRESGVKGGRYLAWKKEDI